MLGLRRQPTLTTLLSYNQRVTHPPIHSHLEPVTVGMRNITVLPNLVTLLARMEPGGTRTHNPLIRSQVNELQE